MSIINVCIFEDQGYRSLYPITTNKASFECRIGNSSLADKIIRSFPNSNISLHCRDYLVKVTKMKHKGLLVNKISGGTQTLFINGRICLDSDVLKKIQEIQPKENIIFTYQGSVIALHLDVDTSNQFKKLLVRVPSTQDIIRQFGESVVIQEINDAKVIQYPWDLIKFQDTVIENDFKSLDQPGIIKGMVGTLASLEAENNIYIGKNTQIENFVYIDASQGPVIIEDHVTICSNTVLRGPLFIGAHSYVSDNSSIKSSSIGMYCKVGGEINYSIFHAYSNKVHFGYIGHSYIGEWVNLAAGTSNSNLKLNYKTIQVQVDNQFVDTNTQFLGCFIGDHSKTSIHTQIHCGSIIGTGSCLLDSKPHRGYVHPFSWGTARQYKAHLFEQFIDTAKAMMKRRNITLEDDEYDLYQLIFNHYQKKAAQ